MDEQVYAALNGPVLPDKTWNTGVSTKKYNVSQEMGYNPTAGTKLKGSQSWVPKIQKAKTTSEQEIPSRRALHLSTVWNGGRYACILHGD